MKRNFTDPIKNLMLISILVSVPHLLYAKQINLKKTPLIINWTEQQKPLSDNISDAIKKFASQLQNKTLTQYYINKEVKQAVKDSMAPYGYFSPTLTLSASQTAKHYIVNVNIQNNLPVRVRNVLIDIPNNDTEWQTVKTSFPLHKNDILLTNEYSKYKAQLFSIASEYGFAEAKMINSLITINREQHWADIHIKFTPGLRFRFGTTTFYSNYFNKNYLMKYKKYHQGEYFNIADIHTLENNLRNTRFFSTLNVEAKPNLKTKRINIVVHTKLAKRYHYELGIGYGTDTGARATIGMQVLPLNHYGQTFEIVSKLAVNHDLVDSSYNIPGKDPVNTNYSIFAHIFQDIIPVGNAYANEIGISAEHIYHPFTKYIISQEFKIYNLDEKFQYTGQNKQQASLLLGAIQFTLAPPIESINATNDFQWSLTVLGSKKNIASHYNFMQYSSQISYLKTIANKWRILFGNQIAYTQTSNLYALPLTLQLLAGGSNSFRGYEYDSLGPGKKLFVSSFDLQKNVKDNWYVGVFYDFGSVSNTFFKPFKQSVGPTITKATNLGGLTVSFAKPINDPKHGWAITFNWGQRL